MNKLKEYAGLLNDEAPKDHFLAYINKDEKDILIKAGGSGKMTPHGILSFEESWDSSVDSPASDSSSSSDSGGWDMDDTGGADHSPEPTGGTGSTGGNDNQPDNNYVPDYESPMTTEQEKIVTGNVVAEDEYLAPDKDHYQATQKAINTAIKEGRDDGTYQADWNDWTKEQQDAYQLEMNKLKGTEDVNYSFYKGNEGTTNLKFNEHWKDVAVTNPALKASPTLRFLVAAGRTLKENFTTDYGTWKYGGSGTSGSGKAVDQGGWMGRIFNSDGSVNENISEGEAQQLYKEALNDLPYLVGGTAPQESMVNKYFANLNNTNLGINQNYLNTYNTAKTNIANTLNMTQNTSQYGYNNILNDTYARSMTSANPFFEELTSEGLI